jgi:hypothetical protein
MLLRVFKNKSSLFNSLLFAISGLFVCRILKQESLKLLNMTMLTPKLSCLARSPQEMNLMIWDLNQTPGISNGLV